MKTMKRLTAALLAVLLLAGLFPVLATAQEQEPEQETVRTSVMIGADGLIESDTLVLGYAKPDAAVTGYPLEWQVLSADKDSQGREGGKLLVSKYLLPAVEESENGNLNMDSLSGIFMPESYTVLPTTLSDGAYVANLNANIISDYKDGKVSYAGLYTQRADDALTAASFFALSAEEAEHYFANSDEKRTENNKNDLLRRPYAAGYAITDAGRRSWALRSLSKTGKGTAVVPAADDDKHLEQVGGLIAAEKAEFSRPAFNLRSNAITFVYQTKVDQTAVSLAGTVTPNETRPQIVDAAVTATKTVTGTGQWRAALHALPTLQLETRICNDGSYILTPPAGFGYKLGVLETNAEGTVISWGVARKDDFGIFTFTPDEGVTDLYFYSFVYDTVSGQLYTSNLVHVGAGAATGMTLGAGHLKNGDTVSFGKMDMYVVNADNASTALGTSDSNIAKTAVNDEYPLWNGDAVFMATKLPNYSMTYKHSSYDLEKAQGDFFDYVYEQHQNPYSGELIRTEYEIIVKEAAASVAAANDANRKNMPSFDPNDPTLAIYDSNFIDAAAYTWTNDVLTKVSGPTTYVYQQKQDWAVYKNRFFLLSAKEYLSADAKTRASLGTTLLRSNIQENFPMTMSPQIETVSYPSAASDNRVITVNESSDVSGVGAALGFNLRRDHIVFMYQKDFTSGNGLSDVPAYDASSGDWELVLLDPGLHIESYESTAAAGENPTISITGAKVPAMSGGGVSYLSVLITDGAGNVKKYGRIADVKTDAAIPVEIDYDALDYGDRVYVVNERQMSNYASGTYVLASEPLLIYEQKMSGKVNFSRNDYLTGETVVADLSNITVSGCETVTGKWCALRGVEETIGNGFFWTADGADETVNFRANLGMYGVNARLNAVEGDFIACNGAHEQDDFMGDTLYYGENGTDNYTWTIVGRQTGGVAAVREKSGTEMLAKDLTTDNVFAIMRKDLTAFGDLKVNGYMTYGVLESDLSDALGLIKGVNFKAGSEKNAMTFRPSAKDYQKFADLKLNAALFASAPTSDSEESWYLRNVSTLSRYGMVDPLQQLQLKKSTPNPTRESVNLNNKDIVFITPADRDLTYADLTGYREGSVDEWKLTVIEPDCISYRELSARHAGNTVTVDCRVSDAMDGRYITAWAEKDGELVWLDSRPAAAADEYHETFTIPEGIEADEAFVVLRKDNGTYHSDVCTLPLSAEPTELKIEIYVNNELTNEGCTVSVFELWSGERRDAFYLGEEVGVSANAEHGYEIIDMDVVFSDGTTDRISGNVHIPAEQLIWSFTMQAEDPVLRVYLRTGEYRIHALSRTFDQNGKEISEPENQVLAPATAHGGNMFTYKVVCKNGYYVDKIYVGDRLIPKEQTIEIAEVKDEETVYILSYAPGDYQAKMPIGSDLTIGVDFRKIPDFALTLVAIPPEGGTITASDTENIKPNTNVTVDAQANEGWVLTKVTMYSDLYPEVELERGENGYTFEMPPAATTVEAWFEKLCPVTVEVYVNGKPTDYGCSWKITDGQGTERSTFYFGEEVNFTATADEGYTVELVQLVDSSMPYLDWDEDSAVGSFPFPGEDAVIQIFLSTQMTEITIDCQTLDVDGTVMAKTAGGEVDAPTESINFNERYLYAALANEGYFVESITANGEPVDNPDPKQIAIGDSTVTAYPSGDYEARGTTENVAYFVTFRKLAEHTITSAFTDISDATAPVPVTDASVIYTVNGEERSVFHAGDEVAATVTCASNYAIDSVDAAANFTQTGKYTFTFTMPDSDLDVTYNLKKLAIRSAYLHVNEDINLIYTVQVPEGFTNPTATFTFMDRAYEVTSYKVGPDGRYHFEFENVTPQYMGEPVDVTVTATYGDKTYSHTNSGYSVQKYCVNMLGKTDDDLLKTLLSDILVYGENAQLYTKYKTDALVTEGVDVSAASTYPGLSGLHEKSIGEADEDVFWNAASLSLSNNVSLVLKFHASDITGLSVKISIDGRTETFTKFTPVEGIEGFYTVSFRGIYATEFDSPVLTSFYRYGEQIGNTLQYSVNIYICKKQDDADQVFANLVKALYNYGASSLKYYQERMRNE